jgi:hypothetical protein
MASTLQFRSSVFLSSYFKNLKIKINEMIMAPILLNRYDSGFSYWGCNEVLRGAQQLNLTKKEQKVTEENYIMKNFIICSLHWIL